MKHWIARLLVATAICVPWFVMFDNAHIVPWWGRILFAAVVTGALDVMTMHKQEADGD